MASLPYDAHVHTSFARGSSSPEEVVRAAEGDTFQGTMNKITKRQFRTVDILYSSEDQLEGARAFAEKRDPVWKGR